MSKKRIPKNELIIKHTDENGIESFHKIKVKNLGRDLDSAIHWVKKTIDYQVWDDSRPGIGMESGSW
jgi:hypothetical protein